jgi:hypothetical protein
MERAALRHVNRRRPADRHYLKVAGRRSRQCGTQKETGLEWSYGEQPIDSLVAGGRYELYSAYPIRVPVVPASVAME